MDFKQFPYEEHGDCFDIGMVAKPAQPEGLCCQLGLQNIFMAMAITANVSRTIFLDTIQALECNAVFQGLHTRTNLSTCKFQDFISSSTSSKCSTDVNATVGLLGIERFGGLRSSCENISKNRSSDEGCFNCLVSYRRSLQALEDANEREGSTPGRSVCAEALLVSLASSEVASKEWVQGLFSCLWDEISKFSFHCAFPYLIHILLVFVEAHIYSTFIFLCSLSLLRYIHIYININEDYCVCVK